MSTGSKLIELNDIESYIPNHLQDRSPRLMDIFMIIGYENIYINEQIIKDINSAIDPKKLKTSKDNKEKEENQNVINLNEFNQKGFGEYKCKDYPSVLSSVTSDLESGVKEEENYFFNIMDFQFYLEICLCSTPVIYFAYDKEKIPKTKIKTRDYVPTIITADANNFCYSYMFYEEKQYNKLTIFVPKLFCIISKYQYYKIFHEICEDIYNIFKSPKVQIPLEVQIYNIINFTPAPSDCKLQLCLFPYQEFNLQKLNSINFYSNGKCLIVDRLSGYSQNQINTGLIFNIFSIETIIETFLELCLFTPIIFFSSNTELLFFIISIFNNLFYPLLDEESIILIPFEAYFEKEVSKNIQHFYGVEIDENIYSEISQKFPDLDNAPNFYLLLESEEKKLISTFNPQDNEIKADIEINQLHKLLLKIIYDEEPTESKMAKIILSTKKNLAKIYNDIKLNNLCNNYYESNNDEININRKIKNIFYKLHLNISNFIYIFERENKEDLKLESEIPEEKQNLPNSLEKLDEIFYHHIKHCHYHDILKNFCKSEEKDITSKNMRLPRKIFSSFLSNLNANPKENREIDYYKIIDSIYYQNNPTKSIYFEFLEFYKYYYHSLDKYFSEVFNPKYVTCSVEAIDKDTEKHFYSYRKIELDPELIMKYLCVLEQMEGNPDTLKEREIILKNEYLYVSSGKTKNLDILNHIEKYYIDNNLLNYKEIIRLCLLYYIIITIPKKVLVFFNKEDYSDSSNQGSKKSYKNFIYDLLDCINLFKNKYIEMLLSVAYRFFKNTNEENYFFIQPYIDIYEKCVAKRKILKTEEIFDVYKEFVSFGDKVKMKYENKIVESTNDDLIHHNSAIELYSFEQKMVSLEVLSKIMDSQVDEKIIEEKVLMNCIYEPKTLSCEEIYSPKKLFNMLKKIAKDFYINLSIKETKEETLKEISVNLLYYCYIMKNEGEIPLDTSKYILLNLIR